MPWRRDARSVRGLGLGDHAAADARRDGDAVLRALDARAFPTVHALAAAPLDDVLAHWAGLGYYARARNLHAAARDVVADVRRARFPRRRRRCARCAASASTPPAPSPASRSARRRRSSTATSCACWRASTRSTARPTTAALKKRVWQRAGELVRADAGTDAGDFNQAMMELGATVCTPASPGCARCPLASPCRARAADRAAALPGAEDEEAAARRRRAGAARRARRQAAARAAPAARAVGRPVGAAVASRCRAPPARPRRRARRRRRRPPLYRSGADEHPIGRHVRSRADASTHALPRLRRARARPRGARRLGGRALATAPVGARRRRRRVDAPPAGNKESDMTKREAAATKLDGRLRDDPRGHRRARLPGQDRRQLHRDGRRARRARWSSWCGPPTRSSRRSTRC